MTTPWTRMAFGTAQYRHWIVDTLVFTPSHEETVILMDAWAKWIASQ